ncbi:hypothetical protein NDU88_002996 [Pleurodeles waltl]|uniref:Uncharacterized protein n=1 Tax=Pleurodeles waltl TaxID=8319 RepID=A0AAV7TP93_PLEWA|nr:hypothetical protein NDU88_002996 [Pleurodeles waltl]
MALAGEQTGVAGSSTNSGACALLCYGIGLYPFTIAVCTSEGLEGSVGACASPGVEQASRRVPLGSFCHVALKGTCWPQTCRAPRPTWRAIRVPDPAVLGLAGHHLPCIVGRCREASVGALHTSPSCCRVTEQMATAPRRRDRAPRGVSTEA